MYDVCRKGKLFLGGYRSEDWQFSAHGNNRFCGPFDIKARRSKVNKKRWIGICSISSKSNAHRAQITGSNSTHKPMSGSQTVKKCKFVKCKIGNHISTLTRYDKPLHQIGENVECSKKER
uniref:Uncharacterized protein n=1 Tax=Physcomitrium patens TaxID=3218 RepID=A0A2K1LBF4_PHYPA|nr:hypothetical protein PHYPA_001790 [Physcomitrium patens]